MFECCLTVCGNILNNHVPPEAFERAWLERGARGRCSTRSDKGVDSQETYQDQGGMQLLEDRVSEK
eukprot:100243-Pyramimonas_sp.AAC.2